jgi:hypothetical protein
MAVHEQARLLVKHAVGGRTFIDSARTPVHYELIEAGTGWCLDVTIPDELQDPLQELLRWRHELNVFLFEEFLQPVKKHWFYVLDNGVHYNDESRRLRIRIHHRLEYIPDTYTW